MRRADAIHLIPIFGVDVENEGICFVGGVVLLTLEVDIPHFAYCQKEQ